jgi:formyltetrahydrofolate deformylase
LIPHVLLITSPDQPGLIHTVTGIIASRQLNIVANGEFVDPVTGGFFMRTEFVGGSGPADLVLELRKALPAGADVRIVPQHPKNIIIFGSKEPHCVADLLVRQANAEIDFNIQCVISNHPVLEPLAARFNIPFFHVPAAESEDRTAHESRLISVIERYRPDYLVLAKYMRVLTPQFVDRFCGKIINIHHSFLPAFAGAQPYRQAYERGVKIIGATAHFVTEALDEGPIIAQSVIPVTHAHTAKSMAQEGREIEKIVLAQALKLVIEDRVFVSGNKTIIFD